MPNYRPSYSNYYNDKGGSYLPAGSIIPVLVDRYSRSSDPLSTDPGIPQYGSVSSPEYAHKGYLYCDGSEYHIRDYPLLYEIIGNTYKKTTQQVGGGLSSVSRTSNVATFQTASVHGLEEGDVVNITVGSRTGFTWSATASSTVTITLNNHGYSSGASLVINFSVTTGSSPTSGTYTIAGVTTNTFTITNSGGSITGTGNATVTNFTEFNTTNGSVEIVSVPSSTSFTINNVGSNLSSTNITGTVSRTEPNNCYLASSHLDNGAIKRSLFVNNKFFLILRRDSSHFAEVKRPAPYGSRIRFSSLGAFPSGFLVPNTLYDLNEPTETISGLATDNSEFAYQVDISTTGITQANYTINFTTAGVNHPNYIISKAYNSRDYPYVIGTFRVPDYRSRKLIGYGSVNGDGSATVENRSTLFVGATGGRWYISKSVLKDSGSFFSVSDVSTSGYSNISAIVPASLIGNVSFTIGPVQPYTFSLPAEHTHILLNSEVDESTEVSASGNPVDIYSVTYRNNRASIIDFIPGETPASIREAPAAGVSTTPTGGTPLSHTHGIIGSRPINTNMSTFGNIAGIGQYTETTTGGVTTRSYRITSQPAIPVSGNLTYTSSGNYVTVTTTNTHSFTSGSYITISGATPSQYNGTFQVLSTGITTTTFRYTPTSTPSSSTSSGTIVLKAADGYFSTQTTTQEPRCWVVDNLTVIGGKPITSTTPGTGVDLQSGELTSAGSTTLSASSGNVTNIQWQLQSPGGGGANTSSNGGTGGNTSASFTLDGVNYVIRVTGGGGGTSGSGGGTGGSAGVVQYSSNGGSTFSTTIPSALQNDSRFQITITSGTAGTNGSTITPSGSASATGGTLGTIASGGNGVSTLIPNTITDSTVTRTSDGTYTIPTVAGTNSITSMTVTMSGGGGGSGNANAVAGCEGTGAVGGAGGSSRLMTGTVKSQFLFQGAQFTYIIGKKGQQGFNNSSGNTEEAYSSGGNGDSIGGQGGRGAWGNGATGGGGGGSTGLYYNGSPIAGVGGGGGGGGSGGGNNGAGTIDGCYAGAAATAGSSDVVTSTTALDFGNGANGGIAGCTAGGGGGGGAGAGSTTSGGGSGGGGVAGVGHNGNGGGSGGTRGGSAYNPNYWNSISFSGTGAGANQDGYITFSVSRNADYYGAVGGGGGAGTVVSFSLAGSGINTSTTLTLGSPGSNATGATAGAAGSARVRYGGVEGGSTDVIGLTDPAGRYYICDSSGVPTASASTTSPLFTSSTPDAVDVVNAGTGTNSTNGFAIPTANSYSGKITKYIKFSGSGTRKLILGSDNVPLDMSTVNKIRIRAIVGQNTNGGNKPEESLDIYYRGAGAASATFYDTVVNNSVSNAGWVDYDINIPEGNSFRNPSRIIEITQTRPSGLDDNATDTADNFGISAITFFYAPVTSQVFVPSASATIPGNDNNTGPDVGIDVVRRTVSAARSGITFSDGTFRLSSSTPIAVSASVVPETDVPLITKYHRVKYLIKAF